MKYQVGDDIVVMHTNEEGKVVEIINEKMVMIEVRGVKFPCYTDQIDFPYFKGLPKRNLYCSKRNRSSFRYAAERKIKTGRDKSNHRCVAKFYPEIYG